MFFKLSISLNSEKKYKKRFVRYLKKTQFILIIFNTNDLVNNEKKIIITIYINNTIYAIKELQLFNKFKAQLKQNFKVKLFKKARLILRIVVKKDIKCKIFYYNHIHYIQKL